MVDLLACTQPKETTNYYFDSQAGNDLNTGILPSDALKSLSKIKDLTLKPGDSILLKSGAVFTDDLYLSCKGFEELPIVLGKYGSEKKPYIKGDASLKQAVHIYNSEHIVIRDIEISNRGDIPIPGLKGIWIKADNYGEARNITVDNLYIHNVGGSVQIQKGGDTALAIQNYRDEDTIPSRFINLLVQNCHIQDCERDAIRMNGRWWRHKWFPSKGVIIRNNRIEGVPGDGIVVVGCDSVLVEYNTVKACPATLPPSEACDGIWPWSSDNTVVQFNVVSDHRSIIDGYAYDSDWNCRNSTFQYNMSYNNTGGFMLVIATNGWPDTMTK